MSSRSAGSLLLIAILAISMGANATAQPAQSHPLSEIVPIDTSLNMEDYAVRNVSELVLNEGTEPEGLVLDDLTITHEGRAQKLVLDYQDNEWRIEDGNLDINGNNISGFFGSPCPSGEFAVDIRNSGNLGCISAANELQDEYVNRAGDTMTGSLDMQGNPVLGLNRLETSGSGVTITDSGNNNNLFTVQETGNVDLHASNLEGVRNLRLVDSGNTDQYTLVYDGGNGRLALSNAGEDVLRIDDSTNNLILPGGGLDMRNSNIVNFFGAACPDGDVMVQVNSDGTFGCVDATSEVQQDFVDRSGDTMTGNLDMQGNNILAPGQITFADNNGDNIQFMISEPGGGADNLELATAGGTRILDLRSTGEVRIPNGNLDISGNSITSHYGSMCPSGEVMVNVNNDGTFDCINVANEVQDEYVNRAGDTMTGTLDMQGNDIQNPGLVDGIHLDSPGNALIEDGSNQLAVAANSIAVTELDEGNVDDRYVQLSGDVMSGSLDMNGNSLLNFFGSACPSGEVVVDVNSDGTYDCMSIDNEVQDTYVNRAGDTMTGTLDMQSNNINSVGTINNGGTTVNTGGDINSGGTVQASADLRTGSGTVTSSAEMCIGNQC